MRGRGRAPGYRTGQREKQTPPTSLKLGDHLAGAGGGGTGGRGDSRNEKVDIEKWFVWLPGYRAGWLATDAGNSRLRISDRN